MLHLRPYLHPTYIGPSILPNLKMSTISTVTASGVRDPTLGDELEIANHICVLAATQGDSTPFHPDSFQEEDMVKLCIGLGQAHPECLLQLLDIETVLMFQYGSIMMAAMHLFTVATV